MSKEVTVVIPAYKAAATIVRAVCSILSQPGLNPRVIVVVDDTTGESEEALSHIANARLTVLTNDRNRGAQFSRNAGLALVETEFVMFLDGDDYVAGELLSGLTVSMERAGADIGFGPWLYLNEAQNVCRRNVMPIDSPRSIFRQWLVDRVWTPPCAVLWRTSYVRQIGSWDENIKRNQDGEIALRAILAGAKYCSSNVGLGVYYQYDSENRLTSSTKNFEALIFVAEKLANYPSSILDQPFVRKALGQYLYNVASVAFRFGAITIGREALAKAREFGFSSHSGVWKARIGSTLLGLERYQNIAQRVKPV